MTFPSKDVDSTLRGNNLKNVTNMSRTVHSIFCLQISNEHHLKKHAVLVFMSTITHAEHHRRILVHGKVNEVIIIGLRSFQQQIG